MARATALELDMRTYHWIFTALGLAGLPGCNDGGPPPAEAPTHRNVSLKVPSLEACLTDTKLRLHHDDGTSDVSPDVSEGLAKYARPGDLIELYFSVQPACRKKFGSRLSLATYTTPGIITYGMKPVQLARAHDMHTIRVGDEEGLLWARLPDCFFQLELAFGEPLPTPSGSDDGGQRVIASTQGGHASCDGVPALEIAAFDTVERGWGDTPLLTHFGWDVRTDGLEYKQPSLTCELDFEGDGKVDQVLSPCPHDTSGSEGIKLPALPVHSFDEPGEHRPELVVSDGTRRLWARTTVLANHLEYKPDVRFPEASAGFVGATLTPAPAPALSELVLTYSAKNWVPFVEVGDVVVGSGVGGGYMLRVAGRSQVGATVTLHGTPVGLDETVAGGYFGVRDLPLAATDMHCLSESCLGALTIVEETPSGFAGPKQPPLVLDGPKLAFAEEEERYGWKITVPLGKGTQPGVESEAEIFGGIVVKKFAIDGLIVGDLTVDIDLAPTLETAVAVVAVIEDSLELGEYYLGALPTPLPVTLKLAPRIDFSSAFKFAGKFAMAMPFQLIRNAAGWDHHFAPEISGDADLLETGFATEAALESKFTLVPEIGLSLGLIDGPYVGPLGSLGIKATANFDDCNFCMTVFAEAGGEFGWHGPWWLGPILEPIQIIIGEFELKKACETMPPPCEPPPPPPPPPGGGGGGTWGDVHVVSHDGLLFDFQAGGEFVLVRATAGAPFEVQTRQEPLGDQRSLSYNTAVATAIGADRVGVYAGQSPPLYIKDGFVDLQPGASVAVGGGLVTRDAGHRYTLTYPSGESVRVDLVGAGEHAHLNVAVELPTGRADHVEGLLGDADGFTANDIGLAGGAHQPQPVSFDQLYRGPDSFTETWRVTQSLFFYAPGTSADTYLTDLYKEMPISTPPQDPAHHATAAAECDTCPASLRDTCMLDVAFTGDPAFAAACHDAPGTPSEVLIPADGFVAVSPRYGAPIDCDDPRVVFRGPGLADADQYPQGKDLHVYVGGFVDSPYASDTLQSFTTKVAPPGGASNWGLQFLCGPIGDGTWGECTLKLDPDLGPCSEDTHPNYEWSVFTANVNGLPNYFDIAVFSRP